MITVFFHSTRAVVGAALALLLGASALAQTVTLDFSAGRLYSNNGTLLPNGTLAILVADTQQNGFGTLGPGTLNVGDYLNGDNQILARGTIDTFFGTGTVGASTGMIPLSSGVFSQLTTNDPLAVIWFPGLTASSFSLTNGASYGLYTDGTWAVPSVGSTQSFQFFTLARGGSQPETAGYASLLVPIPEPATVALAMGGVVIGVAGCRRRDGRKNAVGE